eukprot:bmy_22082T0
MAIECRGNIPGNGNKVLISRGDEPLKRRYGLREFVVIAPAANNDAVLSESKCNLLLSSVQVPLFVQIHHKWRRLYVGECQGPGVRTDFEMVHLRKVPNQYTHLSGLLDIFKSKIGCPLTPLPPVSIAIRFTYVLQDWQQYFWPQQPPDIDALVGGEVGGLEFGKLPFGACEDPISDLDPVQAPHWSVRVRKADNPQCLLGDFVTEFFKICRRKESTDEILGRSTFEEEGREVADITHALSKLTEPAPVPIHKLSVSNMVHTAKKKIRKQRGVEESPLNNDFLFPDAASEKPLDGTSSTDNSNPTLESEEYNLYNQFKSAPSGSLTYKLALCLCMINFYHGGLKGVAHLWQEFVLEMRFRWENNFLIPGLASGPPDLRCCLLHQKLQMLNCCIERKKARDEGRKTSPSDNVTNTYSGDAGKSGDQLGPDNLKDMDKEKGEVGKSWDSWSDSEEEFFECLSDTEELKGNGQESGKKGGPKEMASLKPEGRLHQHGKLTLLHNGEPLYIPVTQVAVIYDISFVVCLTGLIFLLLHIILKLKPLKFQTLEISLKCAVNPLPLHQKKKKFALAAVLFEVTIKIYNVSDSPNSAFSKKSYSRALSFCASQEPAPMTEDLLEEQSEVLAKLGTSAEGAHLRARMQSACLLSDMESFKAANPGCFLEDFVRWYSPRDYIEEEVIDEKGNMGEGRGNSELLVRKITWKSLENISSVKKIIKQIISHSSKVLHFPNPEDKKLEEIIHQITNVEAIIARARSLKAKFGTEKCEQEEEKEDLERDGLLKKFTKTVERQFVSCLLEQPEVLVVGAGRGHAGRIIHKLFVNAQRPTVILHI